MTGVDICSVFLRAALGITMVAHGYRHAFGGGKLPGTARWFESIGIKPGRVHALVATVTEVVSGVLLLAGFLTPLAAAGVVGTMSVALIANHLKNGFFIFNPGEGYEYVLFIVLTGFGVGALGGGKISLDNAFNLHHLYGWDGLGLAAIGAVGAAGLLITCWRPPPPKAD